MLQGGQQWIAVRGAGTAVGTTDMVAARQYSVTVNYQCAGQREGQPASLPLSLTPTDFPVEAIVVSDEQAQLHAPDLEVQEATTLNAVYGRFTPVQLWQGPFNPPVQGRVTTSFGARRSYQGGPATGSHAGLDLAVPLGTPVFASAAGRVAWIGSLPDRGQGVIVDHGLGVFSGYFHLSRILVQLDQTVARGDTVGLAGSTGLSTGPHSHIAMFYQRLPFNPPTVLQICGLIMPVGSSVSTRALLCAPLRTAY